MYQEALYPKTATVLKSLRKVDLLSQFYLAGKTGLALQLGHRKSIDLDFFTSEFPSRDILLQNFSSLKPEVLFETQGTIDLEVKTVKVSFLEYHYPLLTQLLDFENIKVASVLDIACMKLSAISSRGTRKDFFDLFFILEKYSLKEILRSFEKKYVNVHYNKVHILKSLLYFSDAELDPEPDMLVKTNWGQIKQRIEQEAQKTISSL